jgi:hypothetical protein
MEGIDFSILELVLNNFAKLAIKSSAIVNGGYVTKFRC